MLTLEWHVVSKIRQSAAFPDGPIWVRTHPVTYLHDVTLAAHQHGWHQVTYAVRGVLEVVTPDVQALVPADRAVLVPAHTPHTERMRAPVSVRTLYLAPGAFSDVNPAPRTLAVGALLRELMVHMCRLAALDQRLQSHARLVAVLQDLLADAADVPLLLPTPVDPRARRLAELMTAHLGTPHSLAQLAGRAGASLRTLERCFLEETGIAVGEWRRRMRLLEAVKRLEAGMPVTQVAFDVGYRTVSAFSAAFSRQFGAPPSRRRTGGIQPPAQPH